MIEAVPQQEMINIPGLGPMPIRRPAGMRELHQATRHGHAWGILGRLHACWKGSGLSEDFLLHDSAFHCREGPTYAATE